jgi:GH25 family lysozyme M1 (1,4-beta-N-acetylmuramidase)
MTTKKKKKKAGSGRALPLVLTAFCLILLFLLAVMLVEHARGGSAVTDPTAQTEANSEESADTVGETVISSLPTNQYDLDAFSTDGQFRRYSGAETWTGIDVSQHQGEIDWSAVAAQGIDFAMIRVGYRGYSQGEINADTMAAANLQGALDAGLEVGVYFFSQAITVDEAMEEARFVLDAIADYDVTYPVTFDWEPIDGEARTDGLDQQTLTQCALAFCQTIEAAGHTPAVYFNQNYGYQGFILPQLLDYEFWLAQYDEIPTFMFHFDLWQYSCTAVLDGISEPVDLNLSFVDYGSDTGNSEQ